MQAKKYVKKKPGQLIKSSESKKSYIAKKNGSYILVIVESPGKTKKLGSYLGKEYLVVSSYGHIIDLHSNSLSVDVDNDFEPSYYVVKNDVIAKLRTAALKASKVIFAADGDREGEMIAWSYKEILNLQENNYERITFNSITKDKIKEAIQNPGKIDMNMVNSQKARRILDRLVGFKISPRLNSMMGMIKLSAGRVNP